MILPNEIEQARQARERRFERRCWITAGIIAGFLILSSLMMVTCG